MGGKKYLQFWDNSLQIPQFLYQDWTFLEFYLETLDGSWVLAHSFCSIANFPPPQLIWTAETAKVSSFLQLKPPVRCWILKLSSSLTFGRKARTCCLTSESAPPCKLRFYKTKILYGLVSWCFAARYHLAWMEILISSRPSICVLIWVNCRGGMFLLTGLRMNAGC